MRLTERRKNCYSNRLGTFHSELFLSLLFVMCVGFITNNTSVIGLLVLAMIRFIRIVSVHSDRLKGCNSITIS